MCKTQSCAVYKQNEEQTLTAITSLLLRFILDLERMITDILLQHCDFLSEFEQAVHNFQTKSGIYQKYWYGQNIPQEKNTVVYQCTGFTVHPYF